MKPSENAKKWGEKHELDFLREKNDEEYEVRTSAFHRLKGKVDFILAYLDEKHEEEEAARLKLISDIKPM